MSREQEVRHLKQADRHIEKAEILIARQLGFIEELEMRGREAGEAKLQLQGFERVLATMLQHRTIIELRIGDIDRAMQARRHETAAPGTPGGPLSRRAAVKPMKAD